MSSEHLLPYTCRRASALYFRRKVPSHLVEIVGRSSWLESLKTVDARVARPRLTQRTADTDTIIDNAQKEYDRSRSIMSRLTPTEQAVIDRAGGLEGLRAKTEETRKTMAYAGAVAGMLADDAITNDDSAQSVAEAVALEAISAQQIERNRSIMARAEMPNLPPPLPIAPLATLQTVLDRWLAEDATTEKRKGPYRLVVRRFQDAFGNVSLKEVTRAHVRDFQDLLRRAPISSRKDIRNAPIRQAIAIADRENLKRASTESVKVYMVALSTLLGFAVSWDYLETSPSEKFRTPQKRQKSHAKKAKKRQPFTAEQIRTVFEQIDAKYEARSDDWWIPRVATYQGARREEVCQLRTVDIHKTGSVWMITITDEEEESSVKTVSSVRDMPLHPRLVELGFLDHWEKAKKTGADHIFTSLKRDKQGKFGNAYGNRFGRFLRNTAKITDRRLVFHSFRHSFEDACDNAGLPKHVTKALFGHAEGGVDYGNGFWGATLRDWLAKVDPLASYGDVNPTPTQSLHTNSTTDAV